MVQIFELVTAKQYVTHDSFEACIKMVPVYFNDSKNQEDVKL